MAEQKTMKIIGIEHQKGDNQMGNYTAQTAKTLGDWAYIALGKHYKKMAKHEQEVLKDKDPEELHQMRVGMRRLRSAIVGFSTALKLPKKAQEKTVGKVARVLGELRDLDVLQDTLETQYYPHLPKKEQALLKLALEALKKQRKKAFKKVKAILTDTTYLHLKQGFEAWLDSPSYTNIAHLDIYTILPDLLLPQMSHILLHSGWLVGVNFAKETENNLNSFEHNSLSPVEVESLLNTQGVLLHDLRKDAKRNRYNMELFTQFYGESYHKYLKHIKEIQTVLGDIQDSFVLGEFLFKTLEFEIQKKMPTLTEKLAATRWQKWQEWHNLQQIFLNPDNRREIHEVILHPLTSSEKIAVTAQS